MTFDYDKRADVLYVTLRTVASPCRYIENEEGVIFRVELESKEIVGVTIPFFSRLMRSGKVSIPEIASFAPSHDLLSEARV
jgi:uncharacterized protein YuzE